MSSPWSLPYRAGLTLGRAQQAGGAATLSRWGVPLRRGVLPDDLEGAPATTTGDIHTGLSAVVFLAMVVSLPVLSRAFGRSESLRSYSRSSQTLAIAVVALFFVADTTITEGVYGGLGERVFILGFYCWLLLASIRVFRLSSGG